MKKVLIFLFIFTFIISSVISISVYAAENLNKENSLGKPFIKSNGNKENFKDIPKDSWAYKAVSDLIKEGVITLYSNKIFKGEVQLSRLEMAAILVRSLKRFNKANIKTRSDIQKLLREFSPELENLGFK